MDSSLATTPLHDWHASHGARLVDFAGWSMPIQYTSISEEHSATRQHAALFDVSHMGRFRFKGAGVAGWLDGLLTRSVLDLRPNRVRYSLVTQDDGGTLDDVLVYRLDQDLNPEDVEFWMVVNASNRERIWDWLQGHAPPETLTSNSDLTCETSMIAIQGPEARRLVMSSLGLSGLNSLPNYAMWYGVWEGDQILVSRTGYTGEDGFELIVPAAKATPVWERLYEAGRTIGLLPAGLGARDTLRLEAGMPLYGHELTESMNPLQARLDFAVNLRHRSFPGHAALLAAAERSQPLRVGIRLTGKRVAREGAVVVNQFHEPVGTVTSGTFAPTLQHPIAMAYVSPDYIQPATPLFVDIRGRLQAAEVVELPFYRRPKTST